MGLLKTTIGASSRERPASRTDLCVLPTARGSQSGERAGEPALDEILGPAARVRAGGGEAADGPASAPTYLPVDDAAADEEVPSAQEARVAGVARSGLRQSESAPSPCNLRSANARTAERPSARASIPNLSGRASKQNSTSPRSPRALRSTALPWLHRQSMLTATPLSASYVVKR